MEQVSELSNRRVGEWGGHGDDGGGGAFLVQETLKLLLGLDASFTVVH